MWRISSASVMVIPMVSRWGDAILVWGMGVSSVEDRSCRISSVAVRLYMLASLWWNMSDVCWLLCRCVGCWLELMYRFSALR
jgi:hypothetical protein